MLIGRTLTGWFPDGDRNSWTCWGRLQLEWRPVNDPKHSGHVPAEFQAYSFLAIALESTADRDDAPGSVDAMGCVQRHNATAVESAEDAAAELLVGRLLNGGVHCTGASAGAIW
jgi:hypothetical protein